jgi:hypothetical protein
MPNAWHVRAHAGPLRHTRPIGRSWDGTPREGRWEARHWPPRRVHGGAVGGGTFRRRRAMMLVCPVLADRIQEAVSWEPRSAESPRAGRGPSSEVSSVPGPVARVPSAEGPQGVAVLGGPAVPSAAPLRLVRAGRRRAFAAPRLDGGHRRCALRPGGQLPGHPGHPTSAARSPWSSSTLRATSPASWPCRSLIRLKLCEHLSEGLLQRGDIALDEFLVKATDRLLSQCLVQRG